jgi:hypothetical protein
MTSRLIGHDAILGCEVSLGLQKKISRMNLPRHHGKMRRLNFCSNQHYHLERSHRSVENSGHQCQRSRVTEVSSNVNVEQS